MPLLLVVKKKGRGGGGGGVGEGRRWGEGGGKANDILLGQRLCNNPIILFRIKQLGNATTMLKVSTT